MSRSERYLALSFRDKLVLAFVVVVASVLIVALLVIRRETDRQIDHFVANTVADARVALGQVERFRQVELLQLGTRFGGSNRLPGALQQAIEGDTAFLASQITYELELAGLSNVLAAFSDLENRPIFATVGGNRIANERSSSWDSMIQRFSTGDTSLVSYQLIGGSLYSVHPVLLQIVTQPVGYLVLGFPVNDIVATQIGDAIRAEVCFLAGGSCVAATEHAHSAAMSREIRGVSPGGQRHPSIDGHKYAVVSERLADNAGAIVFALRLDDVLAPFAHIQAALRIVGLIALLAGVVLAVLIARGLARPVRTLVSATERIARGDYTTQVEISSRDELGKLCSAFNQMTGGLQLRDHYRGLLDKVVSRDIADELLKGEIVLGGENREVTVLFADIRRFTPLTRGMEPQRVIGLLNEVMDGLSAAVEAEEGVVDKYVGDQLMALFGAPIGRPDDPQRAVRAALKMQAAMEQWSAARSDDPIARVGIGINTGIVVAGNMGSQRRLNYTVLGEPVNLAARLCAAAEPGQILVSAATNTKVALEFATADLGARYMKGFNTPVPVFEVLDFELPLVSATT